MNTVDYSEIELQKSREHANKLDYELRKSEDRNNKWMFILVAIIIFIVAII